MITLTANSFPGFSARYTQPLDRVPLSVRFGGTSDVLDDCLLPKKAPNYKRSAALFSGLTLAYMGLTVLVGKLVPGWGMDIDSAAKALTVLGFSASGGLATVYYGKHREITKSKKQKDAG